MKTFIMIAALLSGTPVLAGIVNPVNFAQDFCRMRRNGVSTQAAIERATTLNYDSAGGEAPQISYNGDATDLDVYLGVRGVEALCPQYLSK